MMMPSEVEDVCRAFCDPWESALSDDTEGEWDSRDFMVVDTVGEEMVDITVPETRQTTPERTVHRMGEECREHPLGNCHLPLTPIFT